MPKSPAYLFSLVLLVSCATIDATDPQVIARAGRTAGVETAAIVLVSRVSWATTDLDYCWMESRLCTGRQNYVYLRESGAVQRTVIDRPEEGLLVLGASNLTFVYPLERDSFSKADAVSIDNITALEMRSFGLSRFIRLTTKDSKKRFYLITLKGPMGVQHDAAGNDRLFDYLKGRLRADARVKAF